MSDREVAPYDINRSSQSSLDGGFLDVVENVFGSVGKAVKRTLSGLSASSGENSSSHPLTTRNGAALVNLPLRAREPKRLRRSGGGRKASSPLNSAAAATAAAATEDVPRLDCRCNASDCARELGPLMREPCLSASRPNVTSHPSYPPQLAARDLSTKPAGPAADTADAYHVPMRQVFEGTRIVSYAPNAPLNDPDISLPQQQPVSESSRVARAASNIDAFWPRASAMPATEPVEALPVESRYFSAPTCPPPAINIGGATGFYPDRGSRVGPRVPGDQLQCPGEGCIKVYKSINRLKQHLNRGHIAPFTCPRFGCLFRGSYGCVNRHLKRFCKAQQFYSPEEPQLHADAQRLQHQLKKKGLKYSQVCSLYRDFIAGQATTGGGGGLKSEFTEEDAPHEVDDEYMLQLGIAMSMSPPPTLPPSAPSNVGDRSPSPQQQRRLSGPQLHAMNSVGAVDMSHPTRIIDHIHSQVPATFASVRQMRFDHGDRAAILQAVCSKLDEFSLLETIARPPAGAWHHEEPWSPLISLDNSEPTTMIPGMMPPGPSTQATTHPTSVGFGRNADYPDEGTDASSLDDDISMDQDAAKGYESMEDVDLESPRYAGKGKRRAVA